MKSFRCIAEELGFDVSENGEQLKDVKQREV